MSALPCLLDPQRSDGDGRHQEHDEEIDHARHSQTLSINSLSGERLNLRDGA